MKPPDEPHALLVHVQERLTQGVTPTQVIEALLPASRAQALAFARRLPLWEEFRDRFSPQVIAIARVISRRGMRLFGLALNTDGRVVEERQHQGAKRRDWPPRSFLLQIQGEEVCVEYAPNYFPNSHRDLLTFLSPHEPPRPHPLSETGTWAHFTSRDAVDACGGPERYAALLAEAMLQGNRDFDAAFHGVTAEAVSRARKPNTEPPAAAPDLAPAQPDSVTRPPLGPHSARVLAGEAAQAEPPPFDDKPRQGLLF